jgi:shikimate dehydrogenase
MRLGVVGWPVAHSRSPDFQNAALRAAGLEGWSYQRLPVPHDAFAETVRGLPAAGFAGVNVTIPHKEAALALAVERTERAAAIGAANTLVFSSEGRIAADNTDAPGLLMALGEPIRHRSALVLGAGGTARAAVWALRQAGVPDIRVWNRTAARAAELCGSLGGSPVERAEPADLLVNCTAHGLGEASGLEGLPVAEPDLVGFGTVVDFVYRPGGTPLSRAAAACGVAVLDGLELLVAQGALSFELFTGRTAPLEVMRAAVGLV